MGLGFFNRRYQQMNKDAR
ncbi:MAG: hypothetical protein EAZ09_01290 [Oscillatoriales cyanobacterium]|nr:MAG: hypothetical protein EAZ18_23370 [Oscillatoriales cyanobacterium]TAH25984.1 MAG: hypothetical protein EAZ09_01290 [Oscillatoriales cyanobacterium]